MKTFPRIAWAWLFLWLVTTAAHAAITTGPGSSGGVAGIDQNPWTTNDFPRTEIIESTATAAQITNKIGSAVPGTLIRFSENGSKYIIPTNTTSWRRPHVAFYVPHGVTVAVGNVADTGTARPLFTDAGTGAVTNWIFGGGTFIISNRLGNLISQTNPASQIYFECENTDATDTASGNPLITILDGNYYIKWTGIMTSKRAYDTLDVGTSAGHWGRVRGNILDNQGGGDALEVLATTGKASDQIWEIDFIRRSSGASGTLVNLVDGATLRNCNIDLSDNSEMVSILLNGSELVLDNVNVRANTTTAGALLSFTDILATRVKIQNSSFTNTAVSTHAIAMDSGSSSTYEFINVTVANAGTGSIGGTATINDRGLRVDKPIAGTITLTGERISNFTSPSAGQAVVFHDANTRTNKTIAGTGDVTASANFGVDNRIIRADGTSKGVQFAEVVINDDKDIYGGRHQTNSSITVTNAYIFGTGAGVWEWADTDASHHARIGSAGVVTTNVNLILPVAPYDGFVLSTLSQATNSTLSYVAGSGAGSVLRVDGGTIGSATVTSNLIYTSALLEPVSQLTNHTANFDFTDRSYLLTNNFHISAISNPGGATAVRYLTIKLENLSGSTKIVSLASTIKRSGTNNVNVANGSAALVQLQSFGSNITNTLGSITLFDSP
jgi:hypothetical protein